MRTSVTTTKTSLRGPARRATAVLLASILVHVAVLSMLRPNGAKRATVEPNTVDVNFVVAPTPLEAQPVEPPKVELPLATPNQPPKRPKRAPSEPNRPDPVPALTALEAPSTARTPNLDTSEAARAFVLSQQRISDKRFEAGQTKEGARDPDGQVSFGDVGAKRYLTEREPPRLQRRGDGTYRYQGHAFEATVEPDGSVSFADDKKRFTHEGGVGARFDVTEHYLRKRGEDPSRVEKNWFLEETSAFRDELAEQWRAKQRRRALLKLRGRLLRISQDTALTHDQKAARVIAIFEDTADDDTGAAAREAIVEFVEANMPTVELLATPAGDKGAL